MSKKTKKASLIAAACLFLVWAILQMWDDPLSVSDVEWNCAWGEKSCECTIEFEIKNTTSEHKAFRFCIRAQRMRSSVKGSSSIDIIDQTYFDAELKSGGVFEFKEVLEYKKEPHNIIVTIISN